MDEGIYYWRNRPRKNRPLEERYFIATDNNCDPTTRERNEPDSTRVTVNPDFANGITLEVSYRNIYKNSRGVHIIN